MSLASDNYYYFLLNIHGPVDQQRLRTALQTIIQQHAILRTIFITHEGTILQALLQHLDLPFSHHNSEGDSETFVRSLSQADTVSPVPLGISPFKCALVEENPSKHTLILRLSHAQFDGVSQAVLYNNLATTYQNQPTTITSSFTDYMHHSFAAKTSTAFDFWRSLLQRSEMITFSRPDKETHSSTSAKLVRVSREISIVKHLQASHSQP